MSVERDIRVPWWSKLTHILAVSSTFVGTRYRGFTTSPALDPLGSSQSSPPPNPQLHLTHLLRVQKPSTFVFPCLPFFFCFFVWTCEASSDWICHRYFLVRAAELNTSQLVEMKNGQVHPLYNIQAILQDGFRFFFLFCFFCFFFFAFYQSHLLHRILIEYIPWVSSMKHWRLVCYQEYEAVCIWCWYWCHILSRALQYQMKRSFACGAKVIWKHSYHWMMQQLGLNYFWQ